MEEKSKLEPKNMDAERPAVRSTDGLGLAELMKELELHQEAIEGMRRVVREAIAVLNGGWWGPEESKERADAIKCRGILRRIVPHDWSSGEDMPTDLLKMAEYASRP